MHELAVLGTDNLITPAVQQYYFWYLFQLSKINLVFIEQR